MKHIFKEINLKTIITLLIGVGMITACNIASNGNITQTENKSTVIKENKQPTKPQPIENKTSNTAKQEGLIEIFDGRKDLDYRDYAKDETSLVQTEFDRKKNEIKEKFGERYCSDNEDENIGLNSIAEGSFTKTNSNQKAYLYTLCSSGSSHFGVGGIVIFENQKTVSHYVYGENGLDQGMIALSDINKDGMDELVLLDFQVHQGYGDGAISIVSFPNRKFNFIGTTTTFSDNGGAVEDEKNTKADAFDIFVQPGTTPVFYRDIYEKKGKSKNWSLVKSREKFTLDKLEAEFLQNYKEISE